MFPGWRERRPITSGLKAVSPIEPPGDRVLITHVQIDTGKTCRARPGSERGLHPEDVLDDRPHRCSLEFALHVVDVMTSILRSGETGTFLEIATTCERPAAMGIEDARSLLV